MVYCKCLLLELIFVKLEYNNNGFNILFYLVFWASKHYVFLRSVKIPWVENALRKLYSFVNIVFMGIKFTWVSCRHGIYACISSLSFTISLIYNDNIFVFSEQITKWSGFVIECSPYSNCQYGWFCSLFISTSTFLQTEKWVCSNLFKR